MIQGAWFGFFIATRDVIKMATRLQMGVAKSMFSQATT